MITLSPAIEVVTDGPANRDNDAHRRFANVDKDGRVGGTEQRPACLPVPVDAEGRPAPTPERWRPYSYGRALELGAALCTEPACFGSAFGGAA